MTRATLHWGVLLLVASLCEFCLSQSQPTTPTEPTTAKTSASDTVPRVIRFSGTMRDTSGTPMSGAVAMTFALYDAPTGGTLLWSEKQTVQCNDQGRYAVLLGATQEGGLPMEVFASRQARWLGVTPDEEKTEHERVQLTSTPYALKAADADTLGGRPASAYILSNPETASAGSTTSSAGSSVAVSNGHTSGPQKSGPLAVGGSGTANFIPLWTDSSNLGNSSMFQSNGNIGIGTTSLTTKLAVSANGLNVNIGDWGCGTNFGAVGFSFPIDCTHYALLGSSTDTYVNRPTGGKLYFREGNATQMTIFPGGNVGIGITGTPSTALSVKGNGANIRVGDFACGTGFGGIGIGNATPSCTNYNLLGDGKNTDLNRPTGGIISLRENNVEQMRIDAGGFVGIGVTNPSTSLSVKGNGANIRVGDFACGSGFGAIGIGTATPSCTNYTLLGDGSNTFLNRPTGGALLFRENNSTQMVLHEAATCPGMTSLQLAFPDDSCLTSNLLADQTGNTYINNNDTRSGNVRDTTFFTTDNVVGCMINFDQFSCSGAHSSVAPVDNGSRKVALYAVEAPENWFEDFGSGQLAKGSATINMEATFAQTINTGMEYHVFLTPNGDCKGLYVASKSRSSFQVRELGGGTSNVSFDYRIVARRKGYEQIRLADKTEMFRSGSRTSAGSHSQTSHLSRVP